MSIKRIDNKENIGYFSERKGFLTNFIFDIVAVEFKDSLYGSFDIRVDNGTTNTIIKGLIVLGPSSKELQIRIIEEGCFIVFGITSKKEMVEIFSNEFDLFKAIIFNQTKIQ